MGGGGGINPMSIISTLVFTAGSKLLGSAPAETPRAAEAAAEQAGQEAEVQAAEARRRADRQKAEAALLAKSRQAGRADLAGQNDPAQSLGSPKVVAPQLVPAQQAAAQLKERLGQ